MAEITIAGIMRSGAFSPNHIGHDAAIFNSVAEQLRKRGCVVNIYSEEEFCSGAVNERFILAMCSEKRSVERLQELEDAGALVINSGYGIENCTRERMMRIFTGSEIAFPESIAASTNEGVRAALNRLKISRCWIKRGDAPTMHKEDVTFVRHAEEAQEVLQEFFLRGIQRAVISRHVEGRLVKFYGVAGTDFFLCVLPQEDTLAKYGFEGSSMRNVSAPPFDIQAIRSLCARAADTLDIKIYGGDCIITPEGTPVIVSFNDWPSFAPCRTEAAPVIARLVMSSIRKKLKGI